MWLTFSNVSRVSANLAFNNKVRLKVAYVMIDNSYLQTRYSFIKSRLFTTLKGTILDMFNFKRVSSFFHRILSFTFQLLFCYRVATDKPKNYPDGTEFPYWTRIVGYCLTTCVLGPIPIWFVYAFVKAPGTFIEVRELGQFATISQLNLHFNSKYISVTRAKFKKPFIY